MKNVRRLVRSFSNHPDANCHELALLIVFMVSTGHCAQVSDAIDPIWRFDGQDYRAVMIERGDSPYKIAREQTGTGRNWRVIRVAVPDMSRMLPAGSKRFWPGDFALVPAELAGITSGVVLAPSASAHKPTVVKAVVKLSDDIEMVRGASREIVTLMHPDSVVNVPEDGMYVVETIVKGQRADQQIWENLPRGQYTEIITGTIRRDVELHDWPVRHAVRQVTVTDGHTSWVVNNSHPPQTLFWAKHRLLE